MFKKLVSNLPFNPSLIAQVSFYARRMRAESSIRRLGFVFMMLALCVQLFAATAAPKESSLAASSNDIIYGGFDNRDQATLHCLNTRSDFDNILAYYGVDCDILSRAETVWISSNDYGGELDSIGRNPVSNPSPRNHRNWNIYGVRIPGVTHTLYMKDLRYWDSGRSSSYKVLRMVNKQHQTIMIMYDCGNIVTIKRYSPPPPPAPPPPPPTDACLNIPGNQPPGYSCDVCPNREGDQTTLAECDVCQNIPGTQNSANECYPCPEARGTDASACLDYDKKARNQTQDIDDADGTTAHGGDTIVYTISVKNNGSVTFLNFEFVENMADVLEYATLVDADGGQLDNEQHIVWPAVDIPSGQTVSKKITIKVKKPVPQTPASSSDPGSFDLIMNNDFFGHSINIKLPPTVIKRTEIVTKELVHTGPGESLAIAAGITVLAGYFFARSRLLAKELDIVREDFAAAGGQ